MKRTFQALAAFWPPLMLVSLIFSTMIEGTRTNIEHLEIIPYLTRWFLLMAVPTIVFYFVAESGPAAPEHH